MTSCTHFLNTWCTKWQSDFETPGNYVKWIFDDKNVNTLTENVRLTSTV